MDVVCIVNLFPWTFTGHYFSFCGALYMPALACLGFNSAFDGSRALAKGIWVD